MAFLLYNIYTTLISILEASDEDLARQVQSGNTKLFGFLLERYEAKMMRYARRFLFGYHDAEDAVQEIFIKAFINIQSFDSRRRFSPWLYRIAHNELINVIKKKGKEPLPFFDPDTLWPHPLSVDLPDKDLDNKETRAILDRCLSALDPKYREPMILYYFEEQDYQKISEIMRIPASTVGVRLKRGRAALQKIYNQLYESGTKN